MRAQAFFLPTPLGPRLCIYHLPQGLETRARVLYLHPFAEEMNKSRRMAALQARALAEAGFAVLQLDLGGCGDSAGDFGDMGWDDWLADVQQALGWLSNQPDQRALPLWLWGLRAGCLLATQAALQLEPPCHLLLWQPTWSGKELLQQFLRLRLAADLLAGKVAAGTEALRQALLQGQALEVAGYTLSPRLAQGLECARLRAPAPSPVLRHVVWLEVSAAHSAQAAPQPSPLPAEEARQWLQPGIHLVRQVLAGPAFWQSAEIDELPQLLNATTAALCAASR